ncbi:hypothetical protein [Sphingobacterium faecale]|uniref:Uncharacterized protein n=1 Tax=Sphingobacterium faecale TaxID=2803775 RepID=A0ABS1R6M7_9SPHI|nr:hypothetical protein [Sphingobacterium faecale]MBL1410356.1 hypothetical protein [Sphingobacterium faecale]
MDRLQIPSCFAAGEISAGSWQEGRGAMKDSIVAREVSYSLREDGDTSGEFCIGAKEHPTVCGRMALAQEQFIWVYGKSSVVCGRMAMAEVKFALAPDRSPAACGRMAIAQRRAILVQGKLPACCGKTSLGHFKLALVHNYKKLFLSFLFLSSTFVAQHY